MTKTTVYIYFFFWGGGGEREQNILLFSRKTQITANRGNYRFETINSITSLKVSRATAIDGSHALYCVTRVLTHRN